MHSQEVNGDAETNFVEVLLEYLKVCKITEALKKQRRVDMALLESMKIASRYQKEAKLNTQSWEATEKVETTSVSQTKLTALWELRAH
jgi:ribulose bisphosphate carboxylase small subunit